MALEESDIEGLSARIVRDMQSGQRFADSKLRFEGQATTRWSLVACIDKAIDSGKTESMPDGALEIMRSLGRESAAAAARETNFGGINRRRLREGKSTQELDQIQLRKGDNPAEIIRGLRNHLAGASASNSANKFPGLTPERAREALWLSMPCAADVREYANERLTVAELQLAASVTDFTRLTQVVCIFGGLKGPDGKTVRVPTTHDVLTNFMHLTPEKIAVMNGMQQPGYLSMPMVSMRYLYTVFLPAVLRRGGMDRPNLSKSVLAYLDEEDEACGLTGVTRADLWTGSFVDIQVFASGSAGVVRDLVDNFPKSDIGQVARIIDPRQYAMMMAAEAVQAYYTGEDNVVSTDRYAYTLLGPVEGNELITKNGEVLVGSWGDAIGSCEAPTLGFASAESDAERVIFRPTVSTNR